MSRPTTPLASIAPVSILNLPQDGPGNSVEESELHPGTRYFFSIPFVNLVLGQSHPSLAVRWMGSSQCRVLVDSLDALYPLVAQVKGISDSSL